MVYAGPTPSTFPEMNSPDPKSKVVVTYSQRIDQTNKEVQELLEAEMGTVEECIRAIEKYGTAEDALDHMMNLQQEDQKSTPEIFPMYHEHGRPTAPLPTVTGFVMYYDSVSSKFNNTTPSRAKQISISVTCVEEQYLKLEELGRVLHELRCHLRGRCFLFSLYDNYTLILFFKLL